MKKRDLVFRMNVLMSCNPEIKEVKFFGAKPNVMGMSSEVHNSKIMIIACSVSENVRRGEEIENSSKNYEWWYRYVVSPCSDGLVVYDRPCPRHHDPLHQRRPAVDQPGRRPAIQ